MNYFAYFVGTLILGAGSSAAAATAAPGECASGFCGTPNNNGGGGGCGCGGSILVAYTDIGETYSTSDDWDSDGFEDDHDNCPFLSNRDQADNDGDQVGNACDNAPDIANKDQADTDGDGIGDVADPDIDNDGIANAADNCPYVRNSSQADNDKDGKGDACDDDDDNDGVKDAVDNCPLVANADQSNSTASASGNACFNDTDLDSVHDNVDNCPGVSNYDQTDTDKDGIGDACDNDVDGDGVANNVDNCSRVANADQADADRDGAGDVCDPDGYCFIAAKNRDAQCLDPKLAFQVTAAPVAAANTGESLPLALYANRDNTGIKYTFTVVDRPPGSKATITNPRGTVHTSELFEYRFDDTKRPTFTPDVPGTYKFALTGELVEPDALFATSVVSPESTASLEVSGPVRSASGCQTSGAGLAPILAALALLARRMRRR